MVAPQQEHASPRTRLTRLMLLGRWASVLAIVAGLSGASVAAADSSFGDEVQAIVSGGQIGKYDDGEDHDNEALEEEEEGQEDGLLPGGQAEQRAQGLGDKTESKDEDHENPSAPE